MQQATTNQAAESDANGVDAFEGERVAEPDHSTSDGPSPEDDATLQAIFGEETTSAIKTLYSKILRQPHKQARRFAAITSKPIEDKQQRTNAHQAIRRVFNSRLNTSTEDNNTIRISVASSGQGKRKGDKGDGRQHLDGGRVMPRGKVGWDELGGEYLHFTLYKENRDTMEAVGFLAGQLKLNPKHFQFAGTKDRRAVTVQRVCVYRTHVERLYGIGKNLRGSKIGDYAYRPDGMDLGDLAGNEFVITLRDCHVPEETTMEGSNIDQRIELARGIVSAAVAALEQKGFINYYGLQRFGTFATSTHTIGLKLLQEDLQGAIDRILQYSPETLAAAQDYTSGKLISSDDKARAEALHMWKTTSDSYRALEKLPRKFAAESNIIKHLGFTERKTGQKPRMRDYQGALTMVPRNLRLMYVHAYQSFVWNVVAGKRWEMFGNQVVEGDLVLVHEHKHKEARHTADNNVGVDEQGEVIIRPATEDSAIKAEGAFVRARALTRAEAESGSYDVFDVVLPLPGWDVEYPKNAVGDYYKEFMASERGGGLDPHNMRRKWKDISLSGSYRKLLSRPGPGKMGFEIKSYTGEDEQLVETDLDRLQGKKAGGQGGEVVSALEGTVQTAVAGQDTDMATTAETGPPKLAIILKMQLGSSTYATMALRELMKAGGVKAYRPEYGVGR